MALQEGQPRIGSRDKIDKLFGIAQDRKPVNEEQLRVQAELRDKFAAAGHFINENIADGPGKAIALERLQEALMWAGKEIFA